MAKRLIRFSKGDQVFDWRLVRLCATSGKTMWECRCKCGNYSKLRETDLIRGVSKRCRKCAMVQNLKYLKHQKVETA